MPDSLRASNDSALRAHLIANGYVLQDRDVEIREGFISFWRKGELALMMMEFPPADPYLQRIDGTPVDPNTLEDKSVTGTEYQ